MSVFQTCALNGQEHCEIALEVPELLRDHVCDNAHGPYELQREHANKSTMSDLASVQTFATFHGLD